MFDALSDRFDGIFKRLRGKGRLSDSDVDEVLREIRVALLEADVNVHGRSQRRRTHPREVPRRRPREEPHPGPAGHQDRPRGAGHDARRRDPQASHTLEAADRRAAGRPPGLGQDDRVGKLARWFKPQGRNPLLVGADLQRPAAVEQLRTLGRQIDVPVFSEPTDPVARRRRWRRRGAAGSAATSSSSTPPAASRSTPS